MTISYNAFFPATVLTTAVLTLFTAPTQPITTLLRGGRMRLTNTTAVAATVTVYNVPAGGGATPANSFVSSKTVGANDYLDVDVPIVPAGGVIQASSGTAASITAHMLSGSYFS